ncbi:MAG TPA: PHP domain-containing protein [Candidatus Sulfomarinibacteraceae bacterium]|nr:PHP domain-containing protein [Candidatus Sulfomarinibacteraceae bacterium]
MTDKTDLDPEAPDPLADEQLEIAPPDVAREVERVGAVITEEETPSPGRMKIDLHCHTEASSDCITPLELFPDRCYERQIRAQAITDHNEIWAAQELQELVAAEGYPLTVIVGEEITTTEGEIIGLFLKERIEAGLTPEESVARIHEQGGLVLLPHGFDPLKRLRLNPAARARIAGQIDIVETFNARISRPRWNRAAVSWADERDLLMSAGSDAHTLADVGAAWVEVPSQPVGTPQQLLDALRGGVPVGKWTHPVIAFGYKIYDWIRSVLVSWYKRLFVRQRRR